MSGQSTKFRLQFRCQFSDSWSASRWVLHECSNEGIETQQETDMTEAVEYVVKDGHTLGYLLPGSSLMGILQGSVLKGGHHWMNGPVLIQSSTIRPATKEDFDVYRVALPPDFR